MQKILFILVFLGLLLRPSLALGITQTDDVLGTSGVGNLQQYLDVVDKDLQSSLANLNVQNLIKDIAKGKMPFTPQTFISLLFKIIFKEITINLKLFGKLIVLAVMAAVLKQMTTAFDEDSVGRLAHLVVFLALMTIAIASFSLCINSAKETVELMVNFIKALLPILVTLIAAEGGIITAGLINPIILFFLGFVGVLLQSIIFPLIYLYAVLMLVNRLSPHFKVERLAGLLKDSILLSLGFVLTVFVGFLSLQGVAGAVGDSLSMKTAKFATGAFLPVVGGTLSDAVEAVAGTATVLKNAVGIFGVIILFCLTIFPAVKVLLAGFVYKLVAAIVEPLGDTMIGGALDDMGKTIIMAFGVMAAAGIMLFFALAVTIGVGNFAVMMR